MSAGVAVRWWDYTVSANTVRGLRAEMGKGGGATEGNAGEKCDARRLIYRENP